jgi:ABC-type lipoprotein export system ATPase subunit
MRGRARTSAKAFILLADEPNGESELARGHAGARDFSRSREERSSALLIVTHDPKVRSITGVADSGPPG